MHTRRILGSLIAILTTVSTFFAQPTYALHTLAKAASATSLASPGLLVIDPTDNRVLVENQPESARIPASVLKLLTTTVALSHFSADSRFLTSAWSTSTHDELLIKGSLDPFLTSSSYSANKFGARFLPSLISAAKIEGLTKLKIYYRGLYPKDIEGLRTWLSQKKIKTTFVKVTSEQADELGIFEIDSITSRPLSKIVSHTILWSDNLVADRLANSVLRKLKMEETPKNLTVTYKEVLGSLGIFTDGLVIRDGSGLSKKNRLSARTVVELLTRIRNDARFSSIYEGLPISGETGTLSNRFSKSPLAIGHVHAKTGWVNNSVTMAGYVESAGREYAFAILADGISPSLKSREAARRKMDKLLETIVMGDH